MPSEQCILCGESNSQLYYRDNLRAYHRCRNCRLIFVPEAYRLDLEEEKQRYDLHENDPDDEGYRSFLARLFIPLNERLQSGSEGLDFGSGPGPTLHQLFEEAGHSMNIFDPFYHDDETVFGETYDFITATEVIEHLHHPLAEIKKLWNCLRPGGWLGLMTKMVTDREAFKHWHYIRDQTHVGFYSGETFRWLSDRLGADLQIVNRDVILLKKREEG